MTETYVIKDHSGSDVLKLMAEGKHPLCPRCGTPLIVALSPESARAQKVNPGMHCPVSVSHFQSTAYFAIGGRFDRPA